MKLNKLLPIVALSGIATIATPLVTSCGDKINAGPWDDFNELPSGGYVSKGTMNLKSGQQYKASWHFGTNDTSVIQILVTKETPITEESTFYDFGSKDNCSLIIDGQEVEIKYQEIIPDKAWVITSEWKASYEEKDFSFTIKAISDFDDAYITVSLPG